MLGDGKKLIIQHIMLSFALSRYSCWGWWWWLRLCWIARRLERSHESTRMHARMHTHAHARTRMYCLLGARSGFAAKRLRVCRVNSDDVSVRMTYGNWYPQASIELAWHCSVTPRCPPGPHSSDGLISGTFGAFAPTNLCFLFSLKALLLDVDGKEK